MRSTFQAVPDQPVRCFELNLQRAGIQYSVLAANGNFSGAMGADAHFRLDASASAASDRRPLSDDSKLGR
jgi:hypothetical protein